MSKMFMNVKEVMEVLEVSESYAYKLMKRLNRELQAMGCQTIAGKVDRKYFYEQFYGTRGITIQITEESKRGYDNGKLLHYV
ncbi:Uncharacterised protein [Dorea longicatena]|nr:Uncharacterised protein [Dorea longicatena]